MAWCGRVSCGAIRQNGGGQYLHRLKEGHHGAELGNGFTDAQPELSNACIRDWEAWAKRLATGVETQILELAGLLGVSPEALVRLGCGWSKRYSNWTFPERDGRGNVIGISTRFRDGQKKRISGGKAGLTYARDWDRRYGPIYLVEGASDTAALMSSGLCAIGRPSNLGGVKYLIELLFDVPLDREIVVVGERDQKETGAWPGKTGAISVATQLAEALERRISWALPPDDAKDARAWLQAMPKLPVDRLADLFTSGIDTKVIESPVTLAREPQPLFTMSLEDWRKAMLKARLESLNRPGVYLDRSPTGAGKSYVDFNAIRVLLDREAAA